MIMLLAYAMMSVRGRIAAVAMRGDKEVVHGPGRAFGAGEVD